MSNGSEERLRVWRQFRDSISNLSDLDKLSAINTFWSLHPFKTRCIDPDEPKYWLNPWDMVHQDAICEYSRAIMMHQTAIMMIGNLEDSQLMYVIDSERQQDYMLVVIGDHVLNYGTELDSFSRIEKKLNIQNRFKSNKKSAYTLT